MSSIKEKVIDILNEYGGAIDISKLDLKYQGTLISNVILTPENEIQFWSGNPNSHCDCDCNTCDNYKITAKFILDKEITNYIYDLIVESF